MTDDIYNRPLKPEEKARQEIDRMLAASGWQVQSMQNLNLGAAYGIAVREFPLTTGFADYLLFANRKAVGVIEAKAQGITLSEVANQSDKYLSGLPANVPHVHEPLPFAYESTGIETFFRDIRDPEPSSRRVFCFHAPEVLYKLSEQPDTLRTRLQNLPALNTPAFTGLPD